ncbi:hypothetical protein CYMTET_26444 [Cymbomonas tetramitiformis]|uniref:Uncharacterized protein n=1 Tax=Cymbomonas tetramitiformis TaxID=36881 RepID=A0AAE0FS27_9CHLO|nr:hypothetical protein CYMTET_26444 [Cymbomonas tetramitiformis]
MVHAAMQRSFHNHLGYPQGARRPSVASVLLALATAYNLKAVVASSSGRRLLTWNEDCKYSGDRITVSEFPDVEGCRFEEDGSTDYKLNEYCGSRSLTEYSQICIEICSLNSECEYWEAKDDGYCWMYPSSNSGETFEDSATNCGVTASSPPSPRPPPQSPPPQRPPPPTLPPPIAGTGAGSSPDCSECLREFTLHGYFFTTSAKFSVPEDMSFE